MKNKEQEIALYSKQLRELIEQIKNAYKVIKSIPDLSLQKEYAQEIYPLIDEYEELKKQLKEILVDYFEMEDEEGLAPNLLFRRLYKSLH